MAPGGAGGSAGSGTSAPSAASATLPGPSPSPSPDVARLLVDKLKAMSRMSMTITAQLDIGGTAATLSGRFDSSGADKYSTLTTTVGDAHQTVEETTWAGTTYTRNAGQPWYQKPAKAGGMGVDKLTSAIQSAKDVGTTTFEGRQVHRLRPSGPPIDPAAIGFEGKGSVDLELLAAIDGTPVRMSFTVDLTQGTTHLSGTMDMTFVADAKPIINAPDPVFTRFVSKNGFSFGHPVTWEPWSEGGWEGFESPNGGIFQLRTDARGSDTLASYAGGDVVALKRDLKATVVSNTALTLAGVPARTIVYRFQSDGADAFGIDVVAIHGKKLVFLNWTNLVGSETVDQATVQWVIDSFKFM
jgi:hypothetical protein